VFEKQIQNIPCSGLVKIVKVDPNDPKIIMKEPVVYCLQTLLKNKSIPKTGNEIFFKFGCALHICKKSNILFI